MKSDAELLATARSDAGAFRELYERYAVRIHAYHLRRSGEAEAAHDLTAETFAQAWLARLRFRDEADGSAGPWLYGIARHVLLVSVRQRRIEQHARERLGILTRADGAATAAPDEAWLDGLDEALARLPEAQQDAIRLRIVEDLTYDEAAARAGATPEVVRSRVSRGLGSLRRQLFDPMETTR